METNEYRASDELSLADILQSIRRHLWLIVVVTILCGAAAWAVSTFVIPEQYQTTAKLYVDVQTEDDAPGTIGDLNYAARLLDTYIQMLDTRVFYDAVSEHFEPKVSPEVMSDFISFSSVGNTEVFELRVTTRDPQLSYDLGNVVTQLAPETIAEFRSGAELKVVDPPAYPEHPSSPNIMRNTMLGLIAGLFIGLLYAFLKEQLDQRIRSADMITRALDVQVLSQIPVMPKSEQTNVKEARHA